MEKERSQVYTYMCIYMYMTARHVQYNVHVYTVHDEHTRQQTQQHNDTRDNSFEIELPQVGFEPTTLCSLHECSATELPSYLGSSGGRGSIQHKARCLNNTGMLGTPVFSIDQCRSPMTSNTILSYYVHTCT